MVHINRIKWTCRVQRDSACLSYNNVTGCKVPCSNEHHSLYALHPPHVHILCSRWHYCTRGRQKSLCTLQVCLILFVSIITYCWRCVLYWAGRCHLWTYFALLPFVCWEKLSDKFIVIVIVMINFFYMLLIIFHWFVLIITIVGFSTMYNNYYYDYWLNLQ